jgi:hypothetical protein
MALIFETTATRILSAQSERRKAEHEMCSSIRQSEEIGCALKILVLHAYVV